MCSHHIHSKARRPVSFRGPLQHPSCDNTRDLPVRWKRLNTIFGQKFSFQFERMPHGESSAAAIAMKEREDALAAVKADIARLSAERAGLRAALATARADVIADIWCPTTGERILLTRDRWADAVATLDRLHSAANAVGAGGGQMIDDGTSAWTVGLTGLKMFVATATKGLIRRIVPRRPAMECPPAPLRHRDARRQKSEGGHANTNIDFSSNEEDAEGFDVGTADDSSDYYSDPPFFAPGLSLGADGGLTEGSYNGWRITTRSEEAALAEDAKARLEAEGDGYASSYVVGLPRDSTSATAAGGSSNHDGGRAGVLVCVGHSSGYGAWPRQCQTHAEAAVTYMAATEEAPLVTALLAVQVAASLLALLLAFGFVWASMRAAAHHRRRIRLTQRLLSEEMDGSFYTIRHPPTTQATTTNSSSTTRSGDDPLHQRRPMSPSASSRSSSPRSSVGTTKAERARAEEEALPLRVRADLRRRRLTIRAVRRCAMVKSYMAALILVVFVLVAAYASLLVAGADDGAAAAAGSSSGSVGGRSGGGFLSFLPRPSGFLPGAARWAGYALNYALGANATGFLASASSLVVTGLLVSAYGAATIAAAAQLAHSAVEDLKSGKYVDALRRVRSEKAARVARRATSPSGSPTVHRSSPSPAPASSGASRAQSPALLSQRRGASRSPPPPPALLR